MSSKKQQQSVTRDFSDMPVYRHAVIKEVLAGDRYLLDIDLGFGKHHDEVVRVLGAVLKSGRKVRRQAKKWAQEHLLGKRVEVCIVPNKRKGPAARGAKYLAGVRFLDFTTLDWRLVDNGFAKGYSDALPFSCFL